MNLKSVPSKLVCIHFSIRSFNSGEKWFFQSPVLPGTSKEKHFTSICTAPAIKRTGRDVYTFTDEISAVIHQSNFFADFAIDRFVFGEIVETQMFSQFDQLIFGQRLAKEFGNLLDFTSQVLHASTHIETRKENLKNKTQKFQTISVYLFKVLVEDEVQIGMMPFVPSVQQMRKERSTVNYPFRNWQMRARVNSSRLRCAR